MSIAQIVTLAQIVAAGGSGQAFAASLMSSLVKGKVSESQQTWIDKLCHEFENPAAATDLLPILEAFRAKATEVRFPKCKITIAGVEVTLSYTAAASEKAKPENRDTVAIASGKWGDPASKWFGRIGSDGGWKSGKDATPELLEILSGFSANPAMMW